MITPELVAGVMPRNPDPEMWADLLEVILPEYNIEGQVRLAAFISQTAHESIDYTALVENLNYSAKGLLAVFGKYYNPTVAERHARNPMAIGSRVYADRMGNGSDATGDGYRYRGRGILQVTGRNNYYQCSQYLFGDDRLVDTPELLEYPEYALRSACWYWSVNNLNAIADTGDVEKMTRRINGGLNGYEDRVIKYNKVLDYLERNYG